MIDIEVALTLIRDEALASSVKSLLATDVSLGSKKLRQAFLFDEAILVAEQFEIEEKYRLPSITDYQRELWIAPNQQLEVKILESPIVYQRELEAGISKPFLLRSANGAWFIWKHESESDWAINNRAELSASIIDRQLNLQVVPFTYSYEQNGKTGIRQFWLHETEMVFLNFPRSVDPIFSKRIRLLDYLIFNRDRRSTNTLIDRKNRGLNPKRLYAIDHGGAFFKRQFNDGTFEKRPPEEVMSFVGAHSIDDLFTDDQSRERFKSLDQYVPFPVLENYLSEFDLQGIAERVTWLQVRL